jgi:acetoacetyl-CoA reductase/3-oxoacyl-[acyl-carrier protein] reductase
MMVSLGLENKVILVTGGSRGIGKATVELLESLKAKVAYTYSHSAELTSESLGIKADVSNLEAMEKAAQEIENKLGPVYGVVANAGITRDNFYAKLTPEDWDAVINVNLKGVNHSIKPFISGMYERKEGSIICLSSISGDRGNIGQTNYGATKAAVIGLVKCLAREAARYGVRVNAIAPGFIETSMIEAIPPKVKEKLIAEIPLGRFGKPEEIAWATAFLLSPVASSYMTGEVLRINGGLHT